ncbi:hypothetical protein GCM10022216_30280 [Sphingobacterium kyonggiense]|uniref:beta-N-acetylhexosaminidase n=1 Tax=Sphingobacterium kyonggiense TaxID=714075 RepID=A0ABP7Z2R0_9SPHI
MNQLKSSLLLMLALGLGTSAVHAQKLQVKWDFASGYNHNDNRLLKLTLVNTDQKAIHLDAYNLWFNSMYPIENTGGNKATFNDQSGNLYRVDFNAGTTLQVKDSLVLHYKSLYPITHTSLTPNGFYLKSKGQTSEIINLDPVEVTALHVTAQEENAQLSALFAKNSLLYKGTPQPILPMPASFKMNNGSFKVGKIWGVYEDPQLNLSQQSGYDLAFRTLDVAGVKGPKNGSDVRVLQNADLASEAYELRIDKSGIEIQTSTAAGAFYAIQSLISLATAEQLQGKSELSFPYVEIKDAPRFAYRGFMMDISRNFKELSVLKKYVDLLASYKLNKFHLHFIDDEGWRLEIPSLPELTEIGSNRSGSFQDGNTIPPAYGSGGHAVGKNYLSKKEFQELLEYAADRFVTIIPEIESPGHGRAAIKAMETRYNRLMKAGKQKEAEEFLLYEAADKSVYNSAQNWRDNVMNPALPSVYRFMDVVLDDIKKMYEEVGLELKLVSLGGDEVPAGSWEKSPAVQELMKKEGMSTVYEVWPYYVKKLHEICASKGMDMAGWEEFGMVNKGQGMVVNEELAHLNLHLDVWNNVIGGGQEDLAYKLANAGYKTVFTSSANYYLDMVWDKDFREPGLKWASITDLYQSYALLPDAFFANMKHMDAGKKLEDAYLAKKVRLTEKGRSNLIGLKAALWAETVLTADRLDYMILPRLFALAERAWAPKEAWEGEQTFDQAKFEKAYRNFAHKVGSQELPKLDKLHGGFKYRLPSVGVMAEKGSIHANVEYPGFKIVYTLDGSNPTSSSQEFPSGGIQAKNGMVVKLATVDANGRIGRISTYTR